jgi:hypothetical protein
LHSCFGRERYGANSFISLPSPGWRCETWYMPIDVLTSHSERNSCAPVLPGTLLRIELRTQRGPRRSPSCRVMLAAAGQGGHFGNTMGMTCLPMSTCFRTVPQEHWLTPPKNPLDPWFPEHGARSSVGRASRLHREGLPIRRGTAGRNSRACASQCTGMMSLLRRSPATMAACWRPSSMASVTAGDRKAARSTRVM